MKFVKIDQEKTEDFVKTEDTIIELLKKDSYSKNFNYEVADFNWANHINENGIEKTQNILNQFQKKFKKPDHAIYICQHISVNLLDWKSKNVFTPHATNGKFKSIPHLAINKGNNKNFHKRKYDISFIGSFETHPCRYISINEISNVKNSLFKDTGTWHFYNRDINKEIIYKNTLSDTKFSLCPRGTGPSTIRLWESIATGCIPIVISDSQKMPLEDIIDWNEIAIFIPLWGSSLVDKVLEKSLQCKNLEEKSDKLILYYEKYFSKENIHKTIYHELRKNNE